MFGNTMAHLPFLRTVAWLDPKNTAIVSWFIHPNSTNIIAEIDSSIFWNASTSTCMEHFTWLYFHINTVFKTIIHQREETSTCLVHLLNSQFLSSFLTSMIPRFEWTVFSSIRCRFKLFSLTSSCSHFQSLKTFHKRTAAVFVLQLLPCWLKAEQENWQGEDSFTKLLLETNELANNALLYMIPLPSLALEIVREIENHPEETIRNSRNALLKRIFPLVESFVKHGHHRPTFHYFQFFHECIDVIVG